MAQCSKTSRKDMKRPESKKASLPDVTRFFKPIFGEGYSEFLYLPPNVAQKMQHMVDEEIQLQDSSGQTWPITISFVNGLLAFHKGWNEFFLHHQLSIGQILVFEHMKGSSCFSVKIYGTDACEVPGSDQDVGEGKNEDNVANYSPKNEAEILFPEILEKNTGQ